MYKINNIAIRTVLFVIVLICGIFVSSFYFYQITSATNTYSIDLESSSTQYLSISDGNQTGLDVTGDITIEAWVKPESLPSSGSAPAIAGKWQGSDRGYVLFIWNDNGTQKILIEYNDSSAARSKWYATYTLNTSSWTHIAATVDVSIPSATLYINGSSESLTSIETSATSIKNTATPFTIGALGDGTEPFDGLIDDIRIWNYTRTSTEIADDRLRELNGNETGLVGYWKLNNSLTDSSDNANTLTNNESALHSTDTPFPDFTESLKVRKSTNESLQNSTVLQNDDELKLSLATNKTYMIDGVIFASSTSAAPDIIIGFFGQSDVKVAIGYTNDVNEMVIESGATSNRITLPADTPTSIHIKGTVKTADTSGDIQLKWAQATSNGNATTVMEGSYLRAESI